MESFKPYYNWNTFNTKNDEKRRNDGKVGFKPYYNWNTFNTLPSFATTFSESLSF